MKKKLKNMLFLSRLLVSSALLVVFPSAAEISVGTMSYSTHYDKSIEYNEDHSGVYIKYGNILAGKYRNSFYRDSIFMAYEQMERINSEFSYGFVLGAANNYPDDMPVVAGYLPIIGLKVKYSIFQVMITTIAVVVGIEIELN